MLANFSGALHSRIACHACSSCTAYWMMLRKVRMVRACHWFDTSCGDPAAVANHSHSCDSCGVQSGLIAYGAAPCFQVINTQSPVTRTANELVTELRHHLLQCLQPTH